MDTVIELAQGLATGLASAVIVFPMTVGAMVIWREREDYLFTLRYSRPWHRCGGRRVTSTHYGTDFRDGGATTALIEWCECDRNRSTPVDMATGELLGSPSQWQWRLGEGEED